MTLLFEFSNILFNIEQAMSIRGRIEPFLYADFLVQLRGRVLTDKHYMDLVQVSTNEELDEFLERSESLLGRRPLYFKTMHHSLRENQRLEMVRRLPGCLVLAVKFHTKNCIFVSCSNGLILSINTVTNAIEKIIANKCALIDCLKVFVPYDFLITAGIDSKIRLWDIKTEQMCAKFEIHKYATQQLILVNNILYSYGGHDMKLVKFDVVCKETDCWINLKSHITCLKLIKYRST